MTVIGTHVAVRTALQAAISPNLSCELYDTWDVRAGNIATLGLIRVRLTDEPDQKYGFGQLVVPVHVYQVVGGSIHTALAYQETNVEKVIEGLGADRTLGGKVVDSEIVSDANPAYYREPNGAAYSIVTFEISVTPFSNKP